MKKTLALILSLALVLSMLTVGFAFTASADEAFDPVAYAEDAWDSAANKATTVYLRTGRNDAHVTLNAENPTVDLSDAALRGDLPYTAGIVTFENGVVTLSGLVRAAGTENVIVDVAGHGAMKVVIDGTFEGSIRNDWSPAGSLFITGSANGGAWTCPKYNSDDVNNFRFNGNLYIYGNLEFDVFGPVYADSGSVNEVLIAPEKDSVLDTYVSDSYNMFFNGNNAKKLIYAGGANITVKTSYGTMFSNANMQEILIDNAAVSYECPEGFGECSGDNYAAYIPAITLQNEASLTVNAFWYDADKNPAKEEISQPAILGKISVDETSGVFRGDELVKGVDPSTIVPDEPDEPTEPEESPILPKEEWENNVLIDYNDAVESSAPIYSLNVAWSTESFTYNAGALVWNPDAFDYTSPSGADGWVNDGKIVITVTNKSNAAVNASVSVNDSAAPNGVSVDVVGEASAVLGDAAANNKTATSAELTIQATGELPAASNGAVIATATVTLSAAQ